MADTFEQDLCELVPYLRGFARRYGQDSEDLVQDVMVKALSHRDSFVPGTNMKAWLFTILRNHYIQTIKTKMRRIRKLKQYEVEEVPQPDRILIAKQELQRVNDLTPPHRRPFLHSMSLGLKVKELAIKFDMPEGTVKSQATRIRQYINGPSGPHPQVAETR